MRAIAVAVTAAAVAAVLAIAWWRGSGAAPAPRLDVEPAVPTIPNVAPASPRPSGRAPAGTVAVPADSISGLVVDAEGAPVAEAMVTAVPAPPAAITATRTDAAGRFAWTGLPTVPLRLLVEHPSFLLVNAAIDVDARGDRRIVVHRRPVVRGHVVDAVNGRPMPRFGAVLVARSEGGPAPIVEAPPGTTWFDAADGAFALVADTVGPHALQVFGARCVAAQVGLDLVADRTVEQDLRLAPGICARGVVRDCDGEVVADAAVTLRLREQGVTASARTIADGTFALPPLAAGAYALAVDPVDQPFLRRTDVLLELMQPEPFFDLQLPPGAAATGTVVPWEEGQTAAVVFAHADGPVRRVAVDPLTGAFAIGGLTPGDQAVFVERTEPTWRSRVVRQMFDRSTAAHIALTAGVVGHIDPVDLVATMARVRGRVVDTAQPERLLVRAFREDEPLPDRASGLFRAAPATDGSFELDGFVPGRWRLQVMFGDEVLAWDVVDLAAGSDVACVLRCQR